MKRERGGTDDGSNALFPRFTASPTYCTYALLLAALPQDSGDHVFKFLAYMIVRPSVRVPFFLIDSRFSVLSYFMTE